MIEFRKLVPCLKQSVWSLETETCQAVKKKKSVFVKHWGGKYSLEYFSKTNLLEALTCPLFLKGSLSPHFVMESAQLFLFQTLSWAMIKCMQASKTDSYFYCLTLSQPFMCLCTLFFTSVSFSLKAVIIKQPLVFCAILPHGEKGICKKKSPQTSKCVLQVQFTKWKCSHAEVSIE